LTAAKRAGIDPKWLIEAIAEINLYLPDDWRLNADQKQFQRIQIISDHSATLVGSCYRTDGNDILPYH